MPAQPAGTGLLRCTSEGNGMNTDVRIGAQPRALTRSAPRLNNAWALSFEFSPKDPGARPNCALRARAVRAGARVLLRHLRRRRLHARWHLQTVVDYHGEGWMPAAPHLLYYRAAPASGEQVGRLPHRQVRRIGLRCAGIAQRIRSWAGAFRLRQRRWLLSAPGRALSTSTWRPIPRCTHQPPPPTPTFRRSPKCRPGANGHHAILFNADAYLRYRDDPAPPGDVPLVPGRHAHCHSTQLMRFSDACGAEIPRWIRQRLQAFW